MKFKFHPGAYFTFFILLIFLGGVVTAGQWNISARLFPWAIGIPALSMCFAQLFMELFHWKEDRDPGDLRGLMDLPVDRSVPVSVVIRRAIIIFGWLIGFFFVIWLIGFILTVPLFVLLYLRVQAREAWGLTLVYTIAVLIFLLGLFHYILHIPQVPLNPYLYPSTLSGPR